MSAFLIKEILGQIHRRTTCVNKGKIRWDSINQGTLRLFTNLQKPGGPWNTFSLTALRRNNLDFGFLASELLFSLPNLWFPMWLYSFILPPAMCENFYCSISLPTFGIVNLLTSLMRNMKFNLIFLKNKDMEPLFSMLIDIWISSFVKCLALLTHF